MVKYDLTEIAFFFKSKAINISVNCHLFNYRIISITNLK